MSHLDQTKPYPFERLNQLFEGVQPAANLRPISWSIGEPQHPTPAAIEQAVVNNLNGLSTYPITRGSLELRQVLASWASNRFSTELNPHTQVLPVLGSREALFSFAQVALDTANPNALVAFPNPFYQIYEGAAFLGGATPIYLNINPETGLPNWNNLTPNTLQNLKLLFVCTPNNPTGAVINLKQWKHLFALSDEYGFVIASDECYSEIYTDETRPPLGALDAATQLGRSGFKNLMVFSSLSKRSNAPGLRSGFVAGDAHWIQLFSRYRTYHGSAMSNMVQKASIAAWQDETHVQENRALYRQKFEAVGPILRQAFKVTEPEAGFYYWLDVGQCDQQFAQGLLATQNLKVLPGSFLGRETSQGNPGKNHLRIALVAPLSDCVEAANRLVAFATQQN